MKITLEFDLAAEEKYAAHYGYSEKVLKSGPGEPVLIEDNPQSRDAFIKEKLIQHVTQVVTDQAQNELRKQIESAPTAFVIK